MILEHLAHLGRRVVGHQPVRLGKAGAGGAARRWPGRRRGLGRRPWRLGSRRFDWLRPLADHRAGQLRASAIVNICSGVNAGRSVWLEVRRAPQAGVDQTTFGGERAARFLDELPHLRQITERAGVAHRHQVLAELRAGDLRHQRLRTRKTVDRLGDRGFENLAVGVLAAEIAQGLYVGGVGDVLLHPVLNDALKVVHQAAQVVACVALRLQADLAVQLLQGRAIDHAVLADEPVYFVYVGVDDLRVIGRLFRVGLLEQ